MNDGMALILAADSVRARLFASRQPGAPLEEVADLLNPDGRRHEGDLVEDDAGRRGTRPTQAKRSAFGGETAKRHRAEEFAAEVCKRVAAELRNAKAERLYIIAEPEFLGLLRMRMDKSVQKKVVEEIPKSITGKAPEEIQAAVFEVVGAT
jgi:protein required for attachment to host cells